MKLLEDKLEALDLTFASKKESEKWGIIAMVAGVIGFLAYTYLLPYTEGMHKKSERKKKSIEKSIADNNIYLSSITVRGDREFYVKKYSKDIVTKKESIQKINDKISFIDANLQKLSDMLFNQKSWSIFLNSITHKAETNNVGLRYLDNTYADNNGSFGHVLEIGIGCQGTYKNIVKFMNELEQNALVTDIFQTSLYVDANSSSDVFADINISVWGINR